jgi:hypothetical protein
MHEAVCIALTMQTSSHFAHYLSLPLFERFGFQQTDSEQADRYGVTFESSLVERVATGPV